VSEVEAVAARGRVRGRTVFGQAVWCRLHLKHVWPAECTGHGQRSKRWPRAQQHLDGDPDQQPRVVVGGAEQFGEPVRHTHGNLDR
jgi:hypothetical protein